MLPDVRVPHAVRTSPASTATSPATTRRGHGEHDGHASYRGTPAGARPRQRCEDPRMSRRDLDRAGITGAALRESYERCRELNAAPRQDLLPRDPPAPAREAALRPRALRLRPLRRRDRRRPRLDADRAGEGRPPRARGATGSSPTCAAASATTRSAARSSTPCSAGTSRSSTSRPSSTRCGWTSPSPSYATYADLYEYVYGSAAVIGLQMVPILEPTAPEAYERAKDLGVAFQLANFVRDVGEDLDRGRVYLPARGPRRGSACPAPTSSGAS